MKDLALFISAVFITGITLSSVSCSTGACFNETNAYMKASFYIDSSSTVMAPDSLTLYGIGMDTNLIYKAETGLTLAQIPLNDSTSSCTLVMKINTVFDTLTAWYSTYPHVLSKECGYSFYHTLDSLKYTKHIIDKITIIKNTITTASEENIRIYYN
ncbi:MAG: DUF6452 family protein [Bacteroidales bacterium]|jgi:hypothetical protein